MDLVSRKKISKKAAEAAAYWVLRLESPECKPTDRLAFEIWRNADPLNSEAYLVETIKAVSYTHLTLPTKRIV